MDSCGAPGERICTAAAHPAGFGKKGSDLALGQSLGIFGATSCGSQWEVPEQGTGMVSFGIHARRFGQIVPGPGRVEPVAGVLPAAGCAELLRRAAPTAVGAGKLAAKGNVTLHGHCAEHATECHRFLLRDLIMREGGWAGTACCTDDLG